jgi:dTDP-4-amino-4,6-dideoxygalactose transaminase
MDIEVSKKELLNLTKKINKNINKYIILYQELQQLNKKMKYSKENYEKYNEEVIRLKNKKIGYNDLEMMNVYNFYNKCKKASEKDYEKYSLKFMMKNIELENFKQKLIDDNFYENNNERFDEANELIGNIFLLSIYPTAKPAKSNPSIL